MHMIQTQSSKWTKENKDSSKKILCLLRMCFGWQHSNDLSDAECRCLLWEPPTCPLMGNAPSPGCTWLWLNGLCSSHFLRTRNLRLGHRSWSQHIELFVNWLLPPSLWHGLSCNYSRDPIAGGRPVSRVRGWCPSRGDGPFRRLRARP